MTTPEPTAGYACFKAGWLVGWLVGCMAGLLVGWLIQVDWLVHWSDVVLV